MQVGHVNISDSKIYKMMKLFYKSTNAFLQKGHWTGMNSLNSLNAESGLKRVFTDFAIFEICLLTLVFISETGRVFRVSKESFRFYALMSKAHNTTVLKRRRTGRIFDCRQ